MLLPRVSSGLIDRLCLLGLVSGILLVGAAHLDPAAGVALLAVVGLAAMAALWASAAGGGWAAPSVGRPSGGASGHVEASTAYWCAVPTPRLPARPRAPGQR